MGITTTEEGKGETARPGSLVRRDQGSDCLGFKAEVMVWMPNRIMPRLSVPPAIACATPQAAGGGGGADPSPAGPQGEPCSRQ